MGVTTLFAVYTTSVPPLLRDRPVRAAMPGGTGDPSRLEHARTWDSRFKDKRITEGSLLFSHFSLSFLISKHLNSDSRIFDLH